MLSKFFIPWVFIGFYFVTGCNLIEPSGVLSSYDDLRQTPPISLSNEDQRLNAGLRKTKLKLGTLYQFNNPDEILSIKEISKTYITWQSSLGHEYVTVKNPFVPAVTWYENINSVVGRRSISNTKGGLFPLKTGGKISFQVDGIGLGGTSAWRKFWSCKANGKTTIKLWDDEVVWKVTCTSNSGEVIVHYYSEEIGLVVKTVTSEQGKEVSRELTAMQAG